MKHFTAGDRVRLNFPGSKLHGIVGTLKHPSLPGGWWLVEADRPLVDPPAGEEPDRHFRAPESWLEAVLAAPAPMSPPAENDALSGGKKPARLLSAPKATPRG